MQNSNLTRTYSLDQSPSQVFKAINQVSTWWSEDFTGASQELNDEFEVRFGDVHYSKQKLTEVLVNKKVAWLVTDSNLSFLKNKTEWTGTKVVFDIFEQDGKTQLVFTHEGLTPEVECYKDCSNGWNQYLQHSLIPYITSGQANPNVLEKEIEEKTV